MIGKFLHHRYKISSLLGEGGMGEVYLALDEQTGQQVAVKVLARSMSTNPESLERFRREAETLRQLDHPNIVKFVDAFDHQGQYVIVMEYVSGGSLHDLLKSGPLPIERAHRIALELCDALIRSHHLNIVHRDLKPDNVLLDRDGKPKLADFGVARLEEGTRMTRTGTQVGTPYYMAPEAWGGKPLDAQADIWSLGIILFEMLAGQVPFGGDTPLAVMGQVNTAALPNLKKMRYDAPAGLIKIIKRMLTRDKKRRYPTMREVAVDLERERRRAAPRPRTVNPLKPVLEKTLRRIKSIRFSPVQRRNAGILTFTLVVLFGGTYLVRQDSPFASLPLPDLQAILPFGATLTPTGTPTSSPTSTQTPTPTRQPTQTAIITPTPVYIEGNILFEDDFEDGNLSPYTFRTVGSSDSPLSYWSLDVDSDGNHVLTGNPLPSVELSARFGYSGWENYSLALDIKFLDQYSNRGRIEIAFRDQSGVGYITTVDRFSLGLGLNSVINNKFSFNPLDGASVSFQENIWHSLRIDAFNSIISVFVNGKKYVSGEFDGPQNGSITLGLTSTTGSASFDNIRVVELISR